MLTYPSINPVAFHLGPWPVYWYGLMYLLGFILAWSALSLRINQAKTSFTQEELSDVIFYGALGVIIGGRLGYMFFYDGQALLTNPLHIFETWKGGMSFHGGLLGVVLAMWIYSKKHHKQLLALTDFIAPVAPLGLALGRIGNFINGELWGRVTTLPWGMIFPNAGDMPRHPSQLYECGLEGILLFTVLWVYSARPRSLGAVSGLFALGYGLARFFVEFFREPDAGIGYFFGWLTEGQLLSLPLILVGILLMAFAYKGKKKESK